MIAASSEAAIAGPKVELKIENAKSDNANIFFMIIFLFWYVTTLNICVRCYASRA
jgi:hypothetical protein